VRAQPAEKLFWVEAERTSSTMPAQANEESINKAERSESG